MEDSSLGRLIAVLISPEKTFRSIAERPTWVAALVVLVLLGVLVSELAFRRMDPEEIVRSQSTKAGQDLSRAELEQRIEVVETFGRVALLTQVVVIGPAVLLIAAVLFWMALKFQGSDISYTSTLSVTLHSSMPWALSMVLSLPIILSRQSITNAEMQRGLLYSNLGVLATEDTSPAFGIILTSIDFFMVWILVLLVFGISVVGRVSKGVATMLSIGTWALFLLAIVGLVSLVT